jgi:hypothetical protein
MSDVGIVTRGAPVALLEEKLKAWMLQQPEWLLIVNMPRQQRRAAMRELANRLYTIPIMDGANTIPRVVRRKAAKSLAHAAKTGQLTEQVQSALLEAAMMEEAVASVALDGETQSVLNDEELEALLAVDGDDGVDVRTRHDAELDAMLDPEGDVKADIEAGKLAGESPGEPVGYDLYVASEEPAKTKRQKVKPKPKVAFIEVDETAPEEPSLD